MVYLVSDVNVEKSYNSLANMDRVRIYLFREGGGGSLELTASSRFKCVDDMKRQNEHSQTHLAI